MLLTDDPGDFRSVNVSISEIRIHRSAAAGERDAGWITLPVAVPLPIDLIRLRDRRLTLTEKKLPPGSYQQIRLVLHENGPGGPPYANSVVTVDSAEYPLKTPSASQSGLKLNHGFTIEPLFVTLLTLDFDAGRSVVATGSDTYILKPVIGVSSSLAPVNAAALP